MTNDTTKKPIKVTVNVRADDSVQFSQWPIDDDDRRVTFEYNNLSYSFVLCEAPRLEIYDLDENGEIGELISSQDIKTKTSDFKMDFRSGKTPILG